MSSPYPAYAPQSPSSNIPYSNINATHTNSYPPHGRFEASATSLDSDSSGERELEHDKGRHDTAPQWGDQAAGANIRPGMDVRAINRTPSPTPSEAKELAKTSVFDWEAMMKWSYRFRREWACALLSLSPLLLELMGGLHL